MTAKDLDSGSVKMQELDDITTCCICTDFFTDPKALPCIHTFCLRCLQENSLKTNKGPGDEMPCPICRRQFKIPPEGFQGLPKNFFIERLIQASNILDQPASSRVLCDACLEDNKEETGKEKITKETEREIPAADAYCVECKHKLCEKCCNEHRKFKFTRNHKLVPMTEHESGQNVMTDLAPGICELHEENVMNVYCADCKTVVCAMCFIDDHKNHEGSHVKKFVDGFRKQIEINAEVINECRSQGETKKAELLKMQQDIQKRVETLECDIENRKDELQQFADKHATSLLHGLCLLRESKLKEIQMESDDIDTYLSSLETYNSYCQKIMAKGSASDICRAFPDLSARAVELQQQCQPMIEREIQSFNFRFRKSELEEFLKKICDNLIGEIEEEGNSKPRKRNKESVLAEQSNETDLLRKEIQIERTEKESLRLANEQLRISINKEKQTIKALKEELDKEKVNYDSRTEKLTQELDKNKRTNSTLQSNNDKLKKELDARNVANNLIQTDIDELKQELDKEKIANNSVQSDRDKLKQDLDKEKLTNTSLQTSNNKLTQEVNTYEKTIKTLEDHVEKLKQELETTKTDYGNKILNLEEKLKHEQSEKEQLMIMQTEEKRKLYDRDKLPYKPDPVLIQTIRTKAAEEGNMSIYGLTILEKELFVLSKGSSGVEVYDSIKFIFNLRWTLKELIEPWSIGSCKINKCLYIFNYKGVALSNEILRIDRNGKLIKKWSTGDVFGMGLSVTDESNVILTVYDENRLNEYSPDGQLIREINLSSSTGICHLRHAIKLSSGHFVVSHGLEVGDLHRVCLVDAEGKLKKSFGGKCGSNIEQMHSPVHLSVDGNEFVMVVDFMNKRVLLLDPDLGFKRVIFSKEKHELRNPYRILLDESNIRLFVADNGWDSEKEIYVHGRILIFDIK